MYFVFVLVFLCSDVIFFFLLNDSIVGSRAKALRKAKVTIS